jgi:predicted Zn-dependent protease
MLTAYSRARQNMLEWTNVKEMSETDIVLVNSNRLYSQLSKLSRSQNNKIAVEILTENINQIRDEKQMYVPMHVKDVIACFEVGNERLPLNTFRRASSVEVRRRKRG